MKSVVMVYDHGGIYYEPVQTRSGEKKYICNVVTASATKQKLCS